MGGRGRKERNLRTVKLPRGYPRKVVKIDGTMLDRKPEAVRKRAHLDIVKILRLGKPTHVLLHVAYFVALKHNVGEAISPAKGSHRKA